MKIDRFSEIFFLVLSLFSIKKIKLKGKQSWKNQQNHLNKIIQSAEFNIYILNGQTITKIVEISKIHAQFIR